MTDSEWKVGEDCGFEPGGCPSPVKFYILSLVDKNNGLDYRELSGESGMPEKMASAYLSRFKRGSLLEKEGTVGPGRSTYTLADRGRERLAYFRGEYGGGGI